jgi:hypothetical protein
MLPQTVYEHDLEGKLTYLNQAGKNVSALKASKKIFMRTNWWLPTTSKE